MIKVSHLTKRYGSFTAVDDLSFEISENGVYGFLGPNGAGKSTTMNIMSGCLSATGGNVLIGGYDIFEDVLEAKKLIGYLPEIPPLYMNETPEEYLTFVAEAKGVKGTEADKQIEEAIRQTKIESVCNRLISKLSKGYKQRVGIAQALIGNPEIIILDEPTAGLDPAQIIEIRALIKQLGQSHTVILSSHILSEVQAICEKVMIISKGKLIAFDRPENLEKLLLSSNEILLTTEADREETAEILKDFENITEISYGEENGFVKACLKTKDENTYDICRRLFFAFAANEKALLRLEPEKAGLEEIFIELTEDTASASTEGKEEQKNESCI